MAQKLTFGFMQDYVSAKGLQLVKLDNGRYRLGNDLRPPSSWVYFDNLTEIQRHLCCYH
jgi:hypothetical protein